jgi:hypothetical protein
MFNMKLHNHNKGVVGLWNAYLGALVILAGFAIAYIFLNQIYVNTFLPIGISQGTDINVLMWIQQGWVWIVIAVVAAFVFGQLSNAKTLGNLGG